MPGLGEQPAAGAQLADPAADERGLVRSDEARTSRRRAANGRSAGSPTSAQNSSRERLGAHSNQWSNGCAPVTTTRSRGTPCSSTASPACTSFQTKHQVGHVAQQPLVGQVVPAAAPDTRCGCRVRLAARSQSLCDEPSSISGVISSRS